MSATGTMVGACLGSEYGKKFDEESYRRIEETSQDVLENNVDGDVGEWSNPNNDANNTIEVVDTIYIEELKNTCRTYTQMVNVNGDAKIRDAKACRGKNGEWKYEKET